MKKKKNMLEMFQTCSKQQSENFFSSWFCRPWVPDQQDRLTLWNGDQGIFDGRLLFFFSITCFSGAPCKFSYPNCNLFGTNTLDLQVWRLSCWDLFRTRSLGRFTDHGECSFAHQLFVACTLFFSVQACRAQSGSIASSFIAMGRFQVSKIWV